MIEKSLAILGSTGSIGKQALDVVDKCGFTVTALTANNNCDLIEKQIRKYKPKMVALADKKAAEELKIRIADTDTRVYSGIEGVCACGVESGCDTVLNSVVGMIGLKPTLDAIDAGKEIALANKETLVAGGKIVMNSAKNKGVSILPVDSEHSAIFQSLQGCPSKSAVKRLILTASGGPFFGKKRNELENVTKEDALKHPNWSMGAKITVDSATMMNKGLELIEASWLFDMEAKDIDIVVHRQSVVHSLVEYRDNSVIAQLGVPDMRIPIQYALTYPGRYESPVKQLSLTDYGTLTFDKVDEDAFECLKHCKKAVEIGGIAPAVANCANEEANRFFREDKIKFLEIGEIVGEALLNAPVKEDYSFEDVLEAEKWAVDFVGEYMRKK